ncbi:MAG: LUD domain-containing protein [Raineya sp.]|nr:LUD domain-containing protein [Raineya sp.]MDW8296401.1 LUD domain-containing protein [Raineya sp.]
MNKDREKVLEAIQKALQKPIAKPAKPDFFSPIYNLSEKNEDLAILFAQNLKNVQGGFCYCVDEQDFLVNLLGFIKTKKLTEIFIWEKQIQKFLEKTDVNFHTNTENLKNAQMSITSCEYLVARTGSVLVSSRQNLGRSLTIFPPVHVVVAFTSQLVYDVETALAKVREKYKVFPSMLSFITGPSRTADIEKTLVLGAHGPRELHVFLIDDNF